jgi:hypothetical protein
VSLLPRVSLSAAFSYRIFVAFLCASCFSSLAGQTPLTKARKYPVAAHAGVLGDYVPCLFDNSQDLSFRSLSTDAPMPTITLSRAEAIAEKLKSIIPEMNIDPTVDLVGKSPLDAVSVISKRIDATTAANVTEKTAAHAYLAGGIGTPVNDWPPDVSCSVSYMEWHETSDVFGRRVANQYVALQVNIRNLSKESEFLIHDIQVAVDTDAAPNTFARFQSSRDKLIVRAVAQRGQTEDRRNLILNTIVMLGAIGGGANAALQASQAGTAQATNFSTALAIFQGAIIPGFANIFPDHTVEHINHINDMTFSASSTSKTVVPVQGSVPLVTFIAERPLEQLPFARCGKEGGTGGKPGSATDPFCIDNVNDSATASIYPKSLSYKHWESGALRLLQSRTYVVVGGVHIMETGSTPIVTEFDCPVFPDGTADLAVMSGASFNCTLKGSHLDKASTVALKQGSTEIAGTLQAVPDGSTATAQFSDVKLNSATGNYDLYITDVAKNESQTGATLSFVIREPTISTVNLPASVPTTAPLVLSLGGTNLDRVATLTLTGGTKAINATLVPPPLSATSTSADQITGTGTATFSSADLQAAKLGSGTTTLTLSATSLDSKAVAVTGTCTLQ